MRTPVHTLTDLARYNRTVDDGFSSVSSSNTATKEQLCVFKVGRYAYRQSASAVIKDNATGVIFFENDSPPEEATVFQEWEDALLWDSL